MNKSGHIHFVHVECFEFLKHVLIVLHRLYLVFKKSECHFTVNEILYLLLFIFKGGQDCMLAINHLRVIIRILHEELLECHHVSSGLFVILNFVDKDTGAIKFTNNRFRFVLMCYLLEFLCFWL